MDFTKLKQDILRKANEKNSGAKQMFNQHEILNSAVDEIEAHKQVANGTFIWVIPYCLQFPFNPIDVDDTTFSAENTYTVPGDPVDFILSLKKILREDESLRALYAGYIGKTADGYDVSTDEITSMDREIFNNFKVPVQLSLDTQKVRTKEAGQYGREFVTELKKDSDGNILPESEALLQARLLDFEQAIVREKLAEYLGDKDRSNLTQDQKDQMTTIRQSKAISYPKKSGIMFVLEYACDQKTQSLKEEPNSINLIDNLKYVNCNVDLLKKIMKRVGKKKDSSMSYLLVQVSYGDGKGSDKPEKIAIADSREFEYIDASTVEDIEDAKKSGSKDKGSDPRPYYEVNLGEEFDKLFSDFNTKGLEGDYERLAKKNVYKFRPLKDEMLRSLFYVRMQECENYVCEDIFNDFIDIIEACNEVTARKLKQKKDEGKLPVSLTKVISTDEESMRLLKEAEVLEKEQSGNFAKTEEDSFTDNTDVEKKGIGDLVNAAGDGDEITL